MPSSFKSLHEACRPVVAEAFRRRNELFEGATAMDNAAIMAAEAVLAAESGDPQGAMIRIDELRAYIARISEASAE